ncbi:MAG TPA: hypothetical protein VIL86_09140 [Tepidisphaeraceae bacterium]|jgi:hypothetical protein
MNRVLLPMALICVALAAPAALPAAPTSRPTTGPSSAPALEAWGEAVNGLQVGLVLTKLDYALEGGAGQAWAEIGATLVLRNAGDKPLLVKPDFASGVTVRLVAETLDGKEVPLMMAMQEVHLGSGVQELAPGKSIEGPVSAAFEAVGSYRLSARYTYSRNMGAKPEREPVWTGQIRSAPLIVRILPQQPAPAAR